MSDEDIKWQEKESNLKDSIRTIEKLGGREETVKSMKAELIEHRKKQSTTNLFKDNVAVAQDAKQYAEKTTETVNARKELLAANMDAQALIVQHQNEALTREDTKLEEAKVECARMKAMITNEATLHKQAIEEKIKQNHSDIEQMQKEMTEYNQKSHLAQEKIRVAGGSAPLQIATPGVTLIPVADGNIVHSNSIVPQEMAQALMEVPLFAQMGLKSEMAGALTEFILTYVNSKSLKVEAPKAASQSPSQPASSMQAPAPNPAGATQGQQLPTSQSCTNVGSNKVQGDGQESAKVADEDVLSEMDMTGSEAEAAAANNGTTTTVGLKKKLKR